MKRKVLYPGSFDPITNGHIDVIRRAVKLFDEVVIAVAVNTEKKPFFSVEERMDFVRKVFKGEKKVRVKSFKGLVVDFAKSQGIYCMIRGIRATSDFEYEFQMALTNRKISKNRLETIFLTPSQEYFYVSSRLSKQLAFLKAPIQDIVPGCVAKALQGKFLQLSKKLLIK